MRSQRLCPAESLDPPNCHHSLVNRNETLYLQVVSRLHSPQNLYSMTERVTDDPSPVSVNNNTPHWMVLLLVVAAHLNPKPRACEPSACRST
jgi:hypothetical protein